MCPNTGEPDLEKGSLAKHHTALKIPEPSLIAATNLSDDSPGGSLAAYAILPMIDTALLTANASQLRFLLVYNVHSKTYELSMTLVIMSLVLQMFRGVGIFFEKKMKREGRHVTWINDLLVIGQFLITVVNVFAATFTITHSTPNTGAVQKPDPE